MLHELLHDLVLDVRHPQAGGAVMTWLAILLVATVVLILGVCS